MIGQSSANKEVVTEPVEVLQYYSALRFGPIETDELTLGAATHCAGKMKQRRRFGAARKNKSLEWGELSLHRVDLFFHDFDLRLIHEAHSGIFSSGRGEFGSDLKELAL